MKKYYILFLLSSSLIFGCTKARKALDFIAVGNEVATLSLVEGEYVIGKTLSSEISNWDSLLQTGLELIFDENEILKVGILTSDIYKTRKGLGVGDSRTDIRFAYGNPMLENMRLRKGNRAIGQMEMLVYKHAIFLFQADTCQMIWMLQEHADLQRIYQSLED